MYLTKLHGEREGELCANVSNAHMKLHCTFLLITNISVKSTGAAPVAL